MHVIDALPAGLSYDSVVLSTDNARKSGGGALVLVSSPSAGATGSLDFSLGNIESTNAGPAVHLDVSARVQNIAGNVIGHTLTNTVQAQLLSSTGSAVSVNPVNGPPVITVLEPRLALALDAPAGDTMDFGVPAQFTARAVNFGTSEAFQPTLQVELSTGLRAADPTGLPLSVAISGGRALTLARGTDYTVSYSSAAGLLSFVLTSSAAYVGTAETLTAAFKASLDNNPVNARVLYSTCAATQYFSRDTSAGPGPDTRTYAFTLAAADGGIADGAAIQTGDDHGDNAYITVRAPVLNLVKSVTPTTALLPVQTTLNWSVSIVNNGPIATQPGAFSDDLGAFQPENNYISTGSLSAVAVSSAPAGFTNASNANGGTGGRGSVSLASLVIPATTTVTVNFSVRISSAIPNQTKLYNQASLVVPGFTNAFLSDSANGDDNNGVEEGNDPANPNDDDPTSVTINSSPGFDFQKTAVDENGGAFMAGDMVTYNLLVRNRGTERSLGSLVLDPVPPNTTYISGSTRLNGTVVTDAGGASPLSAGLPVNTPGESAGVLAVYTGSQEALLSFRVKVATDIAPGTLISNQGFLSGKGEGTGTPISKPSDDPSTAPSPDPTDLIISGGAFLLSEKTVVPDGFVAAGDTLTYTITVRNIGDADADLVVLKDSEPANASYIAGSLFFDPDGHGPSAQAAVTDAADSDRGDFNAGGSGGVTVRIGTVAAHGEVSVSFQSRVSTSAAGGTVIANQAGISAAGLPDIRSDGDGDHGNGNQPVYNIVGSGTAALRQTKQVFDINGGEVLPGDTLEYLITTFNISPATATNVRVTDNIPPAHTVYSTGTTVLDGTALADVSGASALVGGYNIGSIDPGQSRLLRVRVIVSSAAVPGTVIENQASYSADGGLAGISDSDLDDGIETGNSPSDPDDDDPTRVEVGGTPGSAVLNGIVWQDDNHDRIPSPGEKFEAGWLVEVLHGGVLVASQVTRADGSYRIANLTPGTGYQVRFRHPATGEIFGRARSAEPGTDLTDGTIRNLRLETGENLFDQDLPLDPNGVLYDSVTRLPLSGVQVFLDGPAGFVPAAHLLPGQDGQVTAADGLYHFDINFAAGSPFGVYTIRFAAPDNYITSSPAIPSAIIPPLASSALCASDNCLDVPTVPDPYLVQLQNTAPAGAQSTDYYLRFQFDSGTDAAVVNNHIPLDPILDNAIFVTKSAQKIDVVRGELVLYTITARNTLSAKLTSIKLHDLLPPGFKYRSGSATLNGAALEPALSGRQLDWAGLTFAAAETKTFKLLLTVGSGVSEGKYVNQAWAINMIVNKRVSNVGAATVQVVPDPLFDCTDITGKVFEDSDADGYQGKGEKGLANVRLATARGWVLNTDAHGRFHIACADIPDEVRGSNFIMKVDEQTLPSGYRMTTENPRVVHLTRGKAANIEFGAAPYQVVRLDLSSASFRAPPPPPPPAPRAPCVPPSVTLRPVWDVVTYTPPIPLLRFDNAKFEVTQEHVDLIRSVVEKVRSMPDIRNIKVKVIGHTDSSPIVGDLSRKIADNWVLSRSRAARVGALLREKMPDIIKEEMVHPEGRADTEPLVPNDTPEGKALNRRVLVEITYERPVRRFVEDPVAGDCSSCLPAHRSLETDWTVLVDSGNIQPLRFKGAEPAVTLEQAADVHAEVNRVQDLPGVRNVKLKVIGHTGSDPVAADLTGTIPDNKALSRAWAESVAAQLQQKLPGHFNKDMLEAEGKADTEPLASTGTPEGNALNRRVEMQVTYEHPEPRVVEVPATGNCSVSSAAPAAVVPVVSTVPAAGVTLPWHQAVARTMTELERRTSVLRLGYCRVPGEKIEEARFRVWQVSEEIRQRWAARPDRYPLLIENEFDGAACAGGKK